MDTPVIKILLIGHIRTALGKGELEIEAEEVSVEELLQIISLMPSQGHLSLSLTSTLITVNGIDISILDEGETKVKAGDKVALIPVTHGG